jgi:hypothetical protein
MVQYMYNNNRLNERKNMKTPQEVIAKLEDAKNGIYSAAELESIWVPNEVLPTEYHDEREGGKTLKRLAEKANEVEQAKVEIPPREQPVIFYDTPEGRGTPERVAILNKYQSAVSNDEEIPYEINEDRLYRNELAFASAINLDLDLE